MEEKQKRRTMYRFTEWLFEEPTAVVLGIALAILFFIIIPGFWG